MNSLPDTVPTLQSIAEYCGVSHVTVWRALKEGGKVHAGTARRIRDYAHKVGYTRDSDARTSGTRATPSPRKKRTSVLVPYNKTSLAESDNETIFWEYIAGITEAARETGTRVELMDFRYRTSEPHTEEARRILSLLHEGIDGILDFGLQPETLAQLHDRKIPLVSLISSQVPAARDWATIRPDHLRGYYIAWEHLLAKGHRRIGFISYCDENGLLHDSKRRNGECLAAVHLIDVELKLLKSCCTPHPCSESELWEALLNDLGPFDRSQWPTAFFCTNDQLADLTARALSANGLRVPEDISLIGFGNSAFSQTGIIPLTTISSPRREIGASMLHMLENIIFGLPSSEKANQVVPMQLIKRASVYALKQ